MDHPSSTAGVPKQQQLLQQLLEIEATLRHGFSENIAHMRVQGFPEPTREEIQVLLYHQIRGLRYVFSRMKNKTCENSVGDTPASVSSTSKTVLSAGELTGTEAASSLPKCCSCRPGAPNGGRI